MKRSLLGLLTLLLLWPVAGQGASPRGHGAAEVLVTQQRTAARLLVRPRHSGGAAAPGKRPPVPSGVPAATRALRRPSGLAPREAPRAAPREAPRNAPRLADSRLSEELRREARLTAPAASRIGPVPLFLGFGFLVLLMIYGVRRWSVAQDARLRGFGIYTNGETPPPTNVVRVDAVDTEERFVL